MTHSVVSFHKLTKLLRFWGVDRAIAYTVLSRGWAVIAGPISVLLISTRLSPAEQGFYYTFGSVLGLQVFFELGLSNVILQFASHEKAGLNWMPQGTVEGDPLAKARLASLLRKSLMWYSVIGLLTLVTVFIAGYFFFSKNNLDIGIEWHLPWLWIVLISTFGLCLSPVFAMLQGCGLVAKIAHLGIYQNTGGNLLLWLALLLGFKLFASPVAITFSALCGLIWLVVSKQTWLRDLLAQPRTEGDIDWRREVWPFQWRIALSWLSGYFIFQLFNPILFALQGAAVAGQMGMSTNVMFSIGSIAMAWVTTKAAPFGSLIAGGEYETLDQQFFNCLWQSTALVVIGGAMFWGGDFYLQRIGHPLSLRLLPPLPLSLLIATAIINHIIAAEAIYLRAHKQEPFLWISLMCACLTAPASYFLGKYFGVTAMMLGYFAITLIVGLGIGTWIFLMKRNSWHIEAMA